MMTCGVNNLPFPHFNVRPVRPYSVTDKLGGGGVLYHLGLRNVTCDVTPPENDLQEVYI